MIFSVKKSFDLNHEFD